MKLTSADLRYLIYDLRVVGAGIKGMARPQSARCAGKICRSATNSTDCWVPRASRKEISRQKQFARKGVSP